ncbi:uncharacterized protein B0H64DRAFT_407741 [Chaetomium fimeti]|uniref:Zn(2)-C6 fungal-type domain-containing protein n=1 Tax=Chaetomium fimeti TaxID=1854472 RepID=A0AAE0H817_9PEZI|nr:hypothetical protein B0H64DRAFT_407741 [Chaetomium fimeti]
MVRGSPRMTASTSAPASSSSTPTRKTMRKGTHSCTECRRRKIRCDSIPGALVCFNCKSRRTPCVSQSGDGTRLDVRQRPESDSPRNTGSEAPTLAARHQGAPQAPDALENSVTDQRAPFLAVLDPSGLSKSPETDDVSPSSRPRLAGDGSGSHSSTGDRRSSRVSSTLPEPLSPGQGESICEALRAGLPSYDSIMKVALAHKGWWVRIHRAVRGMYDETIEPFPDFVRRAYTSDRPSELGKMAIAFAFVSDVDGSHIYTLVDRFVVSDMVHMSTAEGLECLILLAVLYADEGQPRRSWMIYRRGVLVAHLTDLYQAGLRSTPKRRLWLSIYQGDRIMSMFLGLPYGFVDMHHQQILEVKPENDYLDSTMTIRCAMIAGKVIDRNHSRTKASISKTLELDEEMNELATSFPETWWELPGRVQADGHDFDEVHVRLHQQLFFFHLRLYIYLPFLSGSKENSVHGSIVRVASMEAARQLLRRYLSLHSDAEGPSPSECKLVDFMAFTGAIVLLLGCSRSSGPGMLSDGNDIEAVLSLIRCLQRQEKQESCPIASQCRKTLTVLLSRSSTDDEVRIPFFGTVVRKGDQTIEQTAPANRSFITNSNTSEGYTLPAGQLSSSTTGTGSAPASEDIALPSSVYLEAPWGIEYPGHMPDLDFLSYLEDVSADFDPGWEFIMDLDSF